MGVYHSLWNEYYNLDVFFTILLYMIIVQIIHCCMLECAPNLHEIHKNVKYDGKFLEWGKLLFNKLPGALEHIWKKSEIWWTD
jgi:hypothetical protein